MAEQARPLTECPRVIGVKPDRVGFLTCGHTEPCPIHGAAPFRVVAPPTPPAEESE